jgi:quercetin dioxygenase-like cupin family protein
MSDLTTQGLIIVGAREGEPHWCGDSRITVKAASAQTNGTYGLILSEARRGTSPPLHIHHTADESIWVISGRLRLRCGDDKFELGAGGFTFMPRDVPHSFLALEDVTMLGIMSPGGDEGFFVEAGPVATTPDPAPLDMERMQAAADKYGDEFVGPPMRLDD